MTHIWLPHKVLEVGHLRHQLPGGRFTAEELGGGTTVWRVELRLDEHTSSCQGLQGTRPCIGDTTTSSQACTQHSGWPAIQTLTLEEPFMGIKASINIYKPTFQFINFGTVNTGVCWENAVMFFLVKLVVKGRVVLVYYCTHVHFHVGLVVD